MPDAITLASLRRPTPTEEAAPSSILRPRAYQYDILEDTSRFILWCKSRQVGGSWCASLKAADNAIDTGEDWVLLSRSLRQAKRLMKKVAIHVRAMDRLRTEKYGAPSIIAGIGTEQIELKNGAAIMAMPCDDETTVGDAANVLLDEFALFPNSEAIFSALTPCIMNGFRVIALSSPRGKRGMFAKIYQDPDNGWSKHTTTLYDAERGGLVLRDQKGNPITAKEFLDDLRKKGMSEQAIRQEFLCELIDEATAFLTLEMIRGVEDAALSRAVNWERLRSGGPFFVGVDIGRYHDLTVIWIWELQEKDLLVCRGAIELRDTPFVEQERRIREIMAHKSVKRCCIDNTGMGIDIGERLADSKKGFGHRVERCTFTESFKAEIATAIKSKVERQEVLIPKDDAILHDWHSIEQIATASGNIRYAADRSAGGHADRFWAAALGVHASGSYRPSSLAMAFGD